jgi:hypothetical protein
MNFEAVWRRIEAHEDEPFRQCRGGEFTYKVESGCVVPNRTNRRLPRVHFQRAYERAPLSGPGQLQDLQGPSYLYAILTDQRVAD